MRLRSALVRLFEYPYETIKDNLPDAASPLWDADDMRSRVFEVHRHTRSILFEWLQNTWRPGLPVEVKHHDYAPRALAEPVYACANKLAAHFPGKIVKLMLAELRPGGEISVHADTAAALTEVHRCHIPLVTSKDIQFYIDDVPHYLEPGYVYEIDNTREHAVANRSPDRRVHLICDIMPPSLVR